MVHRLAPGAEVWAGEDGPVGGGDDGTCNGGTPNSSVCGTFATVPWYANDLGVRATLGFRQVRLEPTHAPTPRCDDRSRPALTPGVPLPTACATVATGQDHR